MLPSDTCDDACSMPGSQLHAGSFQSLSKLAFSSVPFLATFLVVGSVAFYRLFPVISSLQQPQGEEEHFLPSDAPPSLRQSHSDYSSRSTRRRIVAVSFSITISLAAVLAELILCEISNLLNPAARTLALKVTLPTLLFLLVVLIPFLEIQSVIAGWGWSFKWTRDGKIPRTSWMLELLGFTIWLMGFWYLGRGVPGTYVYTMASQTGKPLSEACLERVGIVGISLMAILSGVAAISSPWQTFRAKSRPISASDVTRKQTGLDATNDMLATKRSKLRALQRKVEATPSGGFVTKVVGSIRGSADTQEIKALELEISGLSSMAVSLSNSLTLLENRLASTRRATSPIGKLFFTPASYAFSIYCVYRILATSITTLRRSLSPSPDPNALNSSDSDPINRVLALLAEHVDPSLDRLAWSRQISFLLSGIILFASFNSVLQTFHMLTKLSPSLLYQTQANLALIIAQISATYVISSALLLRSNLPPEMKSVVSEALGSPLEPGFVERWFEGWFILATLGTAVRIWVGRKVLGGPEDFDDWDDYEGLEMSQKRS